MSIISNPFELIFKDLDKELHKSVNKINESVLEYDKFEVELFEFVENKNSEKYNSEWKRNMIKNIKPHIRNVIEACMYVGVSTVISIWAKHKTRIEAADTNLEWIRNLSFKIYSHLIKITELNLRGDEFWLLPIQAIMENMEEETLPKIKNILRARFPNSPKSKNDFWKQITILGKEIGMVWFVLEDVKNEIRWPPSRLRTNEIKNKTKVLKKLEIEAIELSNILFSKRTE
jgi:hypothetical protein